MNRFHEYTPEEMGLAIIGFGVLFCLMILGILAIIGFITVLRWVF